MLYSSVIPFYKGIFLGTTWQNLTFDNLLSLDERNDYAFTVPYKRVIHYDSQKGRVYIPSFYIFTDIEYNSAQPVDCTAVKILFGNGTSLLSTQNSPVNQTFYNFIDNLIFNYTDDGYLLAVSQPTYLELPNWYLGPISIALQFRRQYADTYYYYYSDRLYITDDIHNYILLEWYNDTNLSIDKRFIPYELGYRPSCYVDALLGKPEYNFEEDIIDRLGYRFVQTAISKKTYRCAFVAPEYLCDSLRIMRICNNKRVTRYDFPNYGEFIDPMTMGFDVTWDDQGHLALVDMSFDVDLVAANPSGYIPLVHGDFNNDYDNSFANF